MADTRDPQEIRDDIDQTREELGDTVEALAAKTDVKGRIRDKRDESADRIKQAAPDSAGQAASTVATKARANRMPLIIAGVAAGAFLLGRATAGR